MAYYSLRQRQPLAPLMLLLGALALGTAVATRVGIGPKAWPVLLVLGALVPLLPLVAGPFTVELAGDRLRWRFGLLRWRAWELPLEHIVKIERARSTWREGWGVRRTGEGMLYNGGGFDCVRIHTADGRRLRLGSPDAGRLVAFVDARLKR